jgi:hypothetical protein
LGWRAPGFGTGFTAGLVAGFAFGAFGAGMVMPGIVE